MNKFMSGPPVCHAVYLRRPSQFYTDILSRGANSCLHFTEKNKKQRSLGNISKFIKTKC